MAILAILATPIYYFNLEDLQCHLTQDIRNLPCVLSVKDFVALTFPDGELVQVRFGKNR